jgi:hypothetical protein
MNWQSEAYQAFAPLMQSLYLKTQVMNKFKTTLNIEKPKHQHLIMSGIWQPRRLEWKEVTEDYLTISRKRYGNKLSMFILQKDLLIHIDAAQKNIRMFNDVIKNPENLKNYDSTDIPDDPEEIKAESEKQLIETRLQLKSLKDISDGHLWRMFNYNYSLLYFLGMHPPSGNIDPGKSFFNEFMHWSNSILDSEIKQFILCDITNYARIGDLIILKNDNSIEIQELKQSKSRRGEQRQLRLKNQEAKRKQFEELANNSETSFEGKRLKILNTDIPFESSLSELEQVLHDAEINTISGKQIFSHLSYACIDFSDSKKLSSIKNINAEIDKFKFPIEKDDFIFPLFSYQRNAYSPNFIPYSIYPLSEKDISDLMFGKKTIIYFLNIDEFCRQFEYKGWKVLKRITDFKEGKDLEFFALIHKNGLTIPIKWPLINNIIFESLKIQNLILLYEEIYKMADKKNDVMYFANFNMHDQIWK